MMEPLDRQVAGTKSRESTPTYPPPHGLHASFIQASSQVLNFVLVLYYASRAVPLLGGTGSGLERRGDWYR